MSTADPAATILLVEDDAASRTFRADNLTADGYELLVADCARDGVRLLETKFPDVASSTSGCPTARALTSCAACAHRTASRAASIPPSRSSSSAGARASSIACAASSAAATITSARRSGRRADDGVPRAA
jgi:CheY-like chemotaxis protein